MPRPRAPWWMYGVAASVLGYLVLMLYADLCGPGATGAGLRFEDGRAVVVAVLPDYPAARAGIEPGDVVITALGLPIHTLFDWRQALENAEVGRPSPCRSSATGSGSRSRSLSTHTGDAGPRERGSSSSSRSRPSWSASRLPCSSV